MTNYQCYCYGMVAIWNILKEKMEVTSDTFYGELHYLWDMYGEEDIVKLYEKMS